MTFHDSDPYSKTASTLLLNNLILVVEDSFEDFQMFRKAAKAPLAFDSLVLTSSSELPSLVTLLPRSKKISDIFNSTVVGGDWFFGPGINPHHLGLVGIDVQANTLSNLLHFLGLGLDVLVTLG